MRRALTDARLNLTRVRAEYLARLAELEYAVGGRGRSARSRHHETDIPLARASACLCSAGSARIPVETLRPTARRRRPAPVRAARVEELSVIDAVRTVGTLAPRDEVRLAFKIGGVVETVSVEAGDRVQEGQHLASLKRAEADAAVEQASASLEKARRETSTVRGSFESTKSRPRSRSRT